MQNANFDPMQIKQSHEAAEAQWRGDNRNEGDTGAYPTFSKSKLFVQERLTQMLLEKLKADPKQTPEQLPLALEAAVSTVQAVSRHLYEADTKVSSMGGFPAGTVYEVKNKYGEELEYLRRFVLMKRDLSDEQILVKLKEADAELLDAVV